MIDTYGIRAICLGLLIAGGLSGCDGGLIGTGGIGTGTADANQGSTEHPDTDVTDGDGSGQPDNGSEGTASPVTFPEDAIAVDHGEAIGTLLEVEGGIKAYLGADFSFTNSDVDGTSDQRAVLKVLNTSCHAMQLTLEHPEQPAISRLILAPSTDETLQYTSGSITMRLSDHQNNTAFFINPANLAAGSSTLLLLSDTTRRAQPQLMVLRARRDTAGPSISRLRLILNNAPDAGAGANFRLDPDESNSASPIEFPYLNAGQSVSDYVDVPSGRYILSSQYSDFIDPVAIDIPADDVLSLVITDTRVLNGVEGEIAPGNCIADITPGALLVSERN